MIRYKQTHLNALVEQMATGQHERSFKPPISRAQKYGVFLVRPTEKGRRGLCMRGGVSLRYRHPVANLGTVFFIILCQAVVLWREIGICGP